MYWVHIFNLKVLELILNIAFFAEFHCQKKGSYWELRETFNV